MPNPVPTISGRARRARVTKEIRRAIDALTEADATDVRYGGWDHDVLAFVTEARTHLDKAEMALSPRRPR